MTFCFCFSFYIRVLFLPTDGAPILLTSNVAMQLADFLSPTLLLRIWKLGFCTQLHGLSFTTFFRRLSNMGPCIFLICDTQKTVRGAYFILLFIVQQKNRMCCSFLARFVRFPYAKRRTIMVPVRNGLTLATRGKKKKRHFLFPNAGECFVFTFKRPETCTSSEDKTDDMDASAFRIAKYATAPLPDTLENVKVGGRQ